MDPQETNRKMEEVLNAMDGAGRVAPGEHVWDHILQRIRTPRVVALPRRVVWVAAASLIVLVSCNIMLLHKAIPAQHSDTMDELVHEYDLNNTAMNLGI